jgi:peroxiredoxin Q/BCP
MGIKVALPLGASRTNPMARGPFGADFRPADCAERIWPSIKARARMTPHPVVRYNFLPRGKTAMDINDKAPEFTLPDQNGKDVSLKDFRGKWVVLYFYPRADTPGCTIEACEFRDSHKKTEKVGAVVLGISPDTPSAQKKFEEKFDLPFTLLGDADKKVCNFYGVIQEKNMYGKKVMGVVRTTFIIGPDGKIKHIFRKVKPEGHAEEVLAYLKTAEKGAA